MTLYSSVIRKKNTSEFLTVLFRITRTTHYLFISRVMTEINYPTSKVGLQCAVLSFVFAEQDRSSVSSLSSTQWPCSPCVSHECAASKDTITLSQRAIVVLNGGDRTVGVNTLL